MSLAPRKSSIHQHLSRHVFKKPPVANTPASIENDKGKVESGFGKLHVGKEVLSVPAAYKSIFSL